jgi:cytoskeletal protein RodZ
MADSFGARLRQRREERQIDLIAISEQTKIKLPLLEGLERDDVSHWPSGIFRRAYIRAYAQMLGLDPDIVVREFLDVHPDPGDSFVMTAAAAAAAEEEFAKTAGPSMRLRTIVDSAIGSLTKLRWPAAVDEPISPAAPARSAEPSAPIAPHPSPEPPPGPEARAQPQAAQPAPAPAIVGDRLSFEEADSPMSHAQQATELAAAEASLTTSVGGPAVPPLVGVRERDDASRIDRAMADSIAAELQAVHDDMLETVARLCTELGRAADRHAVQDLLKDSAAALNATGLIVWLWDDIAEGLIPVLVHGYSDRVLAQLPAVKRDADNATAAAFRSAHACEVAATEHTSGALVVPMSTPDDCAGVLAIELQPGVRPTRSVRAVASMIAAALTQLVYRFRQAQQRSTGDRSGAEVTAPLNPPGPPARVRR